MEAQEQVGLVFIRKGYSVGKRQIMICGTGEEHLSSAGIQKSLQAARDVQGEFLFIVVTQNTFGARVFSTVARVDYKHRLRGKGWTAAAVEQWLNRFIEVQRVEKRLPIRKLRRESQVQLHPIPLDELTAGSQQ